MVPLILLAGCGTAPSSPPSPGLQLNPSNAASAGNPHVAPGATAAVINEPVSREQWLSYHWEGEGDPPTPLPVVRETTEDDHLDTVGSCMEDAGWPNTSAEPGAIEHSVPNGQWQAYLETMFQCYAQYPLAPEFYQPYNQAQLEALHAYQTDEMSRCLTEAGFPPDEPPSLEKFVSDWRTQANPRWFPYDNVPDVKVPEMEKLCPLNPEGFYDLATLP